MIYTFANEQQYLAAWSHAMRVGVAFSSNAEDYVMVVSVPDVTYVNKRFQQILNGETFDLGL